MGTTSTLEHAGAFTPPDVTSEFAIEHLAATDGFVAIGTKDGQINGAIYDANAALIANITGVAGTRGAVAALAGGNIVIASQDADSVLFTIVNGTTGAIVTSGAAQQATGRNVDVTALPGGGFAIAYHGGPSGENNVQIDVYSATGVHQTSRTAGPGDPDDRPEIVTLTGGRIAVVFTEAHEPDAWRGDYVGAHVQFDPAVADSPLTHHSVPGYFPSIVVTPDGDTWLSGSYYEYFDDDPRDGGDIDTFVDVLQLSNGSNVGFGADVQLIFGDGRLATSYMGFVSLRQWGGIDYDNDARGLSAFFGLGKVASIYTEGGTVKGQVLQGVEVGTSDNFTGDDWVDRVTGKTLDGGANNDQLTAVLNAAARLSGGDGNDTLTGGNGRDTLIGGAGADVMRGGAGDDVYRGASAAEGDVINDIGGIDTVESDVSIGLEDFTGIEVLRLTGSGNIDGRGNGLDNRLIGNDGFNVLVGGAGSDTLDGGAGPDEMRGSSGDDIYIVDDAGDVIIEPAKAENSGVDRVESRIDYTLGTGVENLTLAGPAIRGEGNALANAIFGNAAANFLKGHGGDDTIEAGLGNDTVRGGDGNDTVSGAAGRDELAGEAGDDRLDGGGDKDRLLGADGSDTLVGGAGADTLRGGPGDDHYYADADDFIWEEDAPAGGGSDTIYFSGSFSLLAYDNIEHLTLEGDGAFAGTGNGLANRITGNHNANVLSGSGGNDTLVGNAGDDRLIGEVGVDRLIGGLGHDIYVDPLLTGATPDVIVELAGGGIDTIESSITTTLAGTPEVERIVLTGSLAIDATGNDVANLVNGNGAANRIDGGKGGDTLNGAGGNDTLIGGNGFDVLSGGAGNDVLAGDNGKDLLIGGGGHDTMTGGVDADTFRFGEFNTGVDTINGFAAAQDRFDLGGGTFSNRMEANGSTTLSHSGGTILVTGVTGLSLAQWNALILPAGDTARAAAAESAEGWHDTLALAARAQNEIVHLGHGDWLYA